MWHDGSFASLAGVVESGAVVAACATPARRPLEPTGNAPFRSDGPWLFSLNGYVKDFRAESGELRAALSRRLARDRGRADTEVLFALVLDRLDRGAAPAAALAAAAKHVTALTEAKLNLLLTDGRAIHGTRFGNSLFARASTIVSEPLDETDEWQEIPEDSLVLATASSPGVVRCTAL